MNDPRTDAVFAAVLARYPGTRTVVRPNTDPGTAAAFPDFVFILDVPLERLVEVTDFTYDVAYAIFGDDPLTFFFDVVDPEQSAQYFQDAPARQEVSKT